ncbi:MAG: alpha/beta hydrolase [Parachlamydiales bacterium]
MLLFLAALLIWDPYQTREQINAKCMEIEAPMPEVGLVEELLVGNTPVRLYYPASDEDLPLILFIHGGAWVGGNLDTHDYLARYLCREVEALVLSVGYQNAPEGKFPGPLQECYQTLRWSQGLKTNGRIAVVGDSAGGNLAAALCLLAQSLLAQTQIDLQVLINPALDLTAPDEFLQWQAALYVTDSQDLTHPLISPLYADRLTGLPPALILVAEEDPLRSDGERYADRLREAGVPTTLYCQQGVGHLAGHAARAAPQALESLQIAVKSLRLALAKF